MKSFLVTVLLIFASVTFHVAPASTQYALLIGVGQYDNPLISELKGASNDARLLAKVLQDKGFPKENIMLLTDGEDAIAPTRANISAALDKLVDTVEQDNFVVFAFAGHGSRQPARQAENNHEPDGKDEFILPKDTGNWNAAEKTAENVILDNEIHVYLEKLRSKGAFVWLIFDNCHAGTMTRALPGEMAQMNGTQRYVDPATLGIPDASATSASRGRVEDTPLDDMDKEEYVAFYATQSTQLEPELKLPAGADKQQMHGLFTYTLAEVLSSYDTLSYRQLGQQILQNYAASGRHTPVPLLEGHLDRMVFGQRKRADKQWPIYLEKNVPIIAAGRLQQLDKGSVLAILAKAQDTTDKALGYAEISAANIFESTLRSVEYLEKPALDKFPTGAYARLVAPHFNPRLRVAKPDTDNKTVQKVLSALDTGHVPMDWVEKEADIYLRVYDSALWLVPADNQLVAQGKAQNISLSLSQEVPRLQTQLSDYLVRIAKVRNLLKLAQRMPGEQMAQIQIVGEIVDSDGSTPSLQGEIPTLKSGAKLRFWVENKGKQAVDVTMLFIDSRYNVYTDYPNPAKESTNRVEAGGKTRMLEIGLDSRETAGIERMMVIAVRARKDTVDPVDFSFLAQERLETRIFIRRSAATHRELQEIFADAGFGTEAPGRKVLLPTLANAAMQVFSWRLME